jgi:hypothetical protein
MPARNNNAGAWILAVALTCGSALAGCSDLYFDRRETVAFGAADAVATDAALQTADPWPPSSANRNFTSNGPRMAGAIERYRTGKVIQPQGLGTSSTGYGNAPATGQGGAPTTSGTAGPSGTSGAN